jgi:hypothetical protein
MKVEEHPINPVGNYFPVIDKETDILVIEWNRIQEEIDKVPWYKRWWDNIRQRDWVIAIKFLMYALDHLVTTIDGLMDNGADKKATVLKALDVLYTSIVIPITPIWLKPFNNKVKEFLLEVVFSIMIDFVVAKYREGAWNLKGQNNGKKNSGTQM